METDDYIKKNCSKWILFGSWFSWVFSPHQLKVECSLNCLGTMLKPFAIYYIAKSKRVMQGQPVLSETFDVCAKFQWMMTLTGFSIKNL